MDTTRAQVVLKAGEHEEVLTSFTVLGDELLLVGSRLSSTLKLEGLSALQGVAGDCSEGHAWGRWTPFVKEETSYDPKTLLWTTHRHPWQAHSCKVCGYIQQEEIK